MSHILVKYPRTPHLPFSHPASDDRVIQDLSRLHGTEVVVTEKLDGENTTLYRDYCHARSLEPLKGQDRGFVKALHARISHEIPENWRICGENVYARHSIAYHDLEDYFFVFSIWNASNFCLRWVETVEWCRMSGLAPVPVLWRGTFDLPELEKLASMLDTSRHEGFVVRTVESFGFRDFASCVAKYVRPNHVTTDHHWRHRGIVPNGLKSKEQTMAHGRSSLDNSLQNT